MAHTYIITGIAHTSDIATVMGTVDNQPVTVITSYSQIQGFPNAIAFQNFIAPLMLANLTGFSVNPPVDNSRNGTFVQ